MFVRLKLVLVDFKKYRGLVVFSTSDASVLFSLAIHYSQKPLRQLLGRLDESASISTASHQASGLVMRDIKIL